MTKAKRNTKLSTIIINHVTSNIKEYVVASLVFVLGVFLGVLFVNNTKESQKEEISAYINTYVDTAKAQGDVSNSKILKEDIKNNVLLACGLWFAGTTLVGIPIVFGIVLFRGFCLGYTISAITYTMGFTKGLAFVLTTIFLQNILFIPAIIALAVSSVKLYKSIMKDKRKENIKIEVIRHTAFSSVMLVVLIVCAFIKVNISGGMLETFIKYF